MRRYFAGNEVSAYRTLRDQYRRFAANDLNASLFFLYQKNRDAALQAHNEGLPAVWKPAVPVYLSRYTKTVNLTGYEKARFYFLYPKKAQGTKAPLRPHLSAVCNE